MSFDLTFQDDEAEIANIMSELMDHVAAIKARDGFTGFPFDRNGIRLGIAALEDEIAEVKKEWQEGRVHHTGYMTEESREAVRKELRDVIAVGIMMYESTYRGFNEAV